MPTKRGRAAALDRSHELELVETDVPGIGSAPRRPVVAEDVRDLQRWTGHGRGRLGRRRVFPALAGLLVRLRQQVERALDAGDHAGGNARVARRRFQFVVTQQRLDDSNVRATLEQVGREAVPRLSRMRALRLLATASRRLVSSALITSGIFWGSRM